MINCFFTNKDFCLFHDNSMDMYEFIGNLQFKLHVKHNLCKEYLSLQDLNICIHILLPIITWTIFVQLLPLLCI